MGKRHTRWSYKTYVRFVKNGRGTGDLSEYKPWITVHDFPSNGKVARILGKKTNRIHHLLSQLEKIYFLILDIDPSVEDIKEQFPLPLDMTQIIAAELGYRHPVVNGFSYVITTDFMIKQSGKWRAVQIKTTEDLQKQRVKEKFAIEKAYYDKIGIDLEVITELDLPKVAADNFFWVTSGDTLEHLIHNSKIRKYLKMAFLESYNDYTIPFHAIIQAIDAEDGVPKGTAMELFKSCLRDHIIPYNPLESICLEEPRRIDRIYRRVQV